MLNRIVYVYMFYMPGHLTFVFVRVLRVFCYNMVSVLHAAEDLHLRWDIWLEGMVPHLHIMSKLEQMLHSGQLICPVFFSNVQEVNILSLSP